MSFLKPVVGSGLFWVNRVVDVFFLIDMGMQFFLPFQSSDKENRTIKRRDLIAYNYISTWFFIDLVAIFPFDLVTHFVPKLSGLRILRTVRLLRLAKLLRVVKSLRIFKRYQSRITISFATLALIKFFLIVVIMTHWCACLWHMIGDDYLQRDNWIVGVGQQDASTWQKYTTAFYWVSLLRPLPKSAHPHSTARVRRCPVLHPRFTSWRRPVCARRR